MVSLYRDPLGENIFSTNVQSSVNGGGALVLMSKDERTLALEARIKELEDLLQERRVRQIKHPTKTCMSINFL